MRARVPVIAIDGPVGTGKGTLSQLLAEHQGWHVLDSGALYRLLAYVATRDGIPLDDERSLARIARELEARFETGVPGEPVRVLLGEEDVSGAIRSERCGAVASKLATSPAVRGALLDLQHAFRAPPGLVADGRDMGTVVFPDAELKIFLIASVEERALRRHKQLMGKGIDVSLDRLLAEINERDKRDSERETAPLKPAEDAVLIDTTDLDVASVFDRVLTIVLNSGLDRAHLRGGR